MPGSASGKKVATTSLVIVLARESVSQASLSASPNDRATLPAP